MVSGKYFWPKAPLLCWKWMPACSVTSVNWMGPEGRGGVGAVAVGSGSAGCGVAEGCDEAFRSGGGLAFFSLQATSSEIASSTVPKIQSLLMGCSASGGDGVRRLAPRGQPHFQQKGRWPDQEKRVERRIDNLIQTHHHFHQRDEERNHALSGAGAHRGFRVANHEENKQLIHRPSDGRDLRLPGMAGDPASQKSECQE